MKATSRTPKVPRFLQPYKYSLRREIVDGADEKVPFRFSPWPNRKKVKDQ